MKSAAIVMDNYKKERFSKALTDAGFKFEEIGSILKKTTTFKVYFKPEDLGCLQRVVSTANNQAAGEI